MSTPTDPSPDPRRVVVHDLATRADRLYAAAEKMAAAALATCNSEPPARGNAEWRAGYAACLAHLYVSPTLAELVKELAAFRRFINAQGGQVTARYGLPDVSGLAADAADDAAGQMTLADVLTPGRD